MEKFISDLCKDKSSEWLDGFAKGIWAFAHWKDGYQYVGTTGTLFQEVMQVIFKIENKIPINFNRKEGKNKLTSQDIKPEEANMI